MVEHGPGRAGRGAAGGIAGDPAVETAAVAFTLGYRDITGFVDLSLRDRALVMEVLERSAKIEAQRRAAEREDLAGRTGAVVARAISRMFR